MAEFEDLTKTIKAEDRKEFSDRLRAAKKASYGDSNVSSLLRTGCI